MNKLIVVFHNFVNVSKNQSRFLLLLKMLHIMALI